MGILVCQACNATIEYFEDEKVSVLYGKCPHPHCRGEEDGDE